MPLKDRIYGFDLLRIFSFIAISLHHFNSKIWYGHDFSPFIATSVFWQTLEVYSRSICYSGITVLFLTSFLISVTSKDHEKAFKIIPFVLLAWIFSSLMDFQENPFFFTWDIFPLIAAGLAVCWLSYRISAISKWVIPILGLTISQIPFWKINNFNSLSLYSRHALIGDCKLDLADWPLLPWIGIILLGYGLGYLAKNYREHLPLMRRSEVFVWGVLLVWTPIFWGSYYHIILGGQFACEIERKDFPILLAHLLPFIFLMRLSILENVQHFLKNQSFANWIQGLKINQMFGYAYIVHFIVIDLIYYFLINQIRQNSELSLFATLMVLPLTEAILRLFAFFQKKIPGKRSV